ncbi:MAG: ABC-F family ATP-binding cassette domain-containing protein [Campylobacterales bacterium]|nr:ABC-F family ATP-binding cassette domain-containing protein [Campylobacterales bacterium]
MQSLQLNNIYFKYPSSSNYIVENLNLEFYAGWTGLVGANGVGKTTLLKLITKELNPERGTFTNNLVTSYSPQSTACQPDNLEEFFTSYDSTAFKLKEFLEIQDDWFYRWNSLSHGERKRVQIAIALFMQPDVLIVDEPTNHLDITTKKRLFKALQSYRGIGILVSHDRELLDLLCTKTIVLKKGSISTIKSNFSTAKDELENRKNFYKEEKNKQDKKLEKIKKQIQIVKEDLSRSKSRLSLKNIDKNDSDAKAKVYLAKISSKNKYQGQAVKSATSKKEQILKEAIILEKEYEKGIFFNHDIDERVFPFVVEKTNQTINSLHFTIPRLTIEKGYKIWIQGDNGSGKTTFLNYLLSTLKKENYLYIPQEISAAESKEIFKEIVKLPQEQQGKIFTIVTRLSSDPKTLLQSVIPSPGEIRKLLIAKELSNNPPLIILDEPTNHMDLDSIISIEKALQEFKGAVIFISHDISFCKNLSNVIWAIQREGDNVTVTSM